MEKTVRIILDVICLVLSFAQLVMIIGMMRDDRYEEDE